jgi:hypothetical protein
MDLQPEVDEEPVRRAMEAMANSYMYLYSALQEFGRCTRWEISAGSRYEVFSSELDLNAGPGGPWDSSEARKLYFVVYNQLHSAAIYMRGIAALLSCHELTSTHPIIRSILEIAGRVGWLLDPRISCRERSARLFLERLDDAKREKSTAKALGEGDKTLTSLGKDLNTIKKTLLPGKFYAEEIETLKNGDLVIVNQESPKFSTSLEYFETALGVDWNSGARYSYLSNMTHPTSYATLERIRVSINVDTDEMTLLPSLDRAFLDRLVRNNAIVFIAIWKLVAGFIGLEISNLDELVTQVDSAISE